MFRIIFVLAILCSYWGLHNPATAQVPIWAFGALPEIDDAAISPDGKTVALLENAGDITVVRFFNLVTGEQNGGLQIGKVKARDLRWASNDRILLLASQSNTINTADGLTEFEFFRYASISTSDARTVYLLNSGDVANFTNAGEILHLLPDEPDHILMAKHDPNYQRRRGANTRVGGGSTNIAQDTSTLNIYKVSLKNGVGKTVFRGTEETVDWIIGTDGTPKIRIDEDGEETNSFFVPSGKRTFKSILEKVTSDIRTVSYTHLTLPTIYSV